MMLRLLAICTASLIGCLLKTLEQTVELPLARQAAAAVAATTSLTV